MTVSPTTPQPLDTDAAVRDRYAAAAQVREAALCCPVDYDARYLEAIPSDVIERDYGCGDPSPYVRPGDTVLDLGSGAGKLCFIAQQVAGPEGRVIGVDINDEMLSLARSSKPLVAKRVGFDTVEFRRGRIQDLALDLDRLDLWLSEHPVTQSGDLDALEVEATRPRREHPLVGDGTVDVVVSNCVLNLVRESAKSDLIREIFRVLKVGGRIAISDIVSDEAIPQELKDNPELWSGCISGAFHELDLLRELEAAGFHGIEIEKWVHEPFAVVALMCRELLSVGYDGRLYDCDFNQMLEIKLGLELKLGARDSALTIWDIDRFDALEGAAVATGAHCFGCTAGAGSSCGGTVA